jgi:hypothetical protein
MMSNRKLHVLGLTAALALGATACNDGLTDVNKNPNNPEDAPAPTVFTTGTRLAVTQWMGNLNLRMFELLSQHLAEVQYPETDAYQRLTATFTEGAFGAAYFQELKDFQIVINKGLQLNAPGYYGPAMVMRSWEYGIMTDLWGDVPYSAALVGDSFSVETRLRPAYDAQKDIYDSIFQTLNTATTAMNGTSALLLGAADPLYSGSMVAWQRFSNSLRARHALRIVNVDPAKASAQLAAAFAAPGGVFTTNAHNARFPWPGNGVYNNPWQVNFQTRDDHRISTDLMALLNTGPETYEPGVDDPRLPIYARPALAAPTIYRGLENALTHSAAFGQINQVSRTGQVTYSASMPAWLMTNAEVKFIQAEAAERGLGGLTPAQAAGFYTAGIRASIDQWAAADPTRAPTEAQITAYMARPDVVYAGGTAGLRQIATQKWIALFTDGIQAYSEWRRTCVPFSVKPGPQATQSNVPRRLLYSTIEKAVNGANVDAAIARQGADAFTTRIYWDKNPQAAPTYQAGCGQR